MNEFAPKDQPEQSAEGQFPEPSYARKVAANNNSPAKKASRWLFKIGIFVLAIGFFFGMKYYNKASNSTDVKKEMYALYVEFPDQARIRKVIDQHHDRCFDATYTMGGRRTKGKFDQDKYLMMMMTSIATELGGDEDFQKYWAEHTEPGSQAANLVPVNNP